MVVRVVKYLVTHVSERAYREAQPTINGKPSQRGAADGYRDLGRPHGPFSPTAPAWISIVGPGSSPCPGLSRRRMPRRPTPLRYIGAMVRIVVPTGSERIADAVHADHSAVLRLLFLPPEAIRPRR